jgi:ribonuclease HI
MSSKKFYAVAKGRKPGIYTQWFGDTGAQAQVRGFPGAVYKGFPTRKEAEFFMKNPPNWGRRKPSGQKADATPSGKHPLKNTIPEENRVIVYTDGGALGNPGPGGYGAVVTLGGSTREFSGGFRLTTNNRMELTACIVGLSALEAPSSVTLYSDSKYVVDGITKGWAKRWRANNWMRTKTDKAGNPDLWARLLSLCEKHDVEFRWVKGHAGNPGNERCDQLVRMESAKSDLPPDRVFEQSKHR